MRKWCYLTLLALTAAAPAKQATINTIVTANSAKASKPTTSSTKPVTTSTKLPDHRCPGTSNPTLSCEAISAQAAIEQARDADWQAYAAAAGSIVGALTLLAAVAAAIFAKRAADETKRTADIAESNAKDTVKALEIAARNASGAVRAAMAASEANDIARQNMQTQLRPYVYLDSIDIAVDHLLSVDYINDTASITLKFKNFGQTPAKSMRLFCKAAVGGYWNARPMADLAGVMGIELSDLPSGSEVVQEGFYAHGIAKAHRDIVAQTVSVFVEGQIQYADAFGSEYVSYFQRAFTGNGYWESKPVITPHWNTAT